MLYVTLPVCVAEGTAVVVVVVVDEAARDVVVVALTFVVVVAASVVLTRVEVLELAEDAADEVAFGAALRV